MYRCRAYLCSLELEFSTEFSWIPGNQTESSENVIHAVISFNVCSVVLKTLRMDTKKLVL